MSKMIELKKIFSMHEVSLNELESLYKDLTKEAKNEWKDNCIMKESNLGMPYLIAEIGYSDKYGIIGRVRWVYSYMNADEENWYYSTRINLIEPVTPFDADDSLYDNKYYNRTGMIPKIVYSEVYKLYKLEIKPFFTVIEELAEILS